MLDSVKVDPATFGRLMFMASTERKEFVRESGVPNSAKPQKRNSDGVPLWSVQVAGVDWRNRSQLFNITVPMTDDPASKFSTGDPIAVDGLVFGVSPKQNGGYTLWASADAMAPALATAAAGRN